jgi:hypothetical protein
LVFCCSRLIIGFLEGHVQRTFHFLHRYPAPKQILKKSILLQ